MKDCNNCFHYEACNDRLPIDDTEQADFCCQFVAKEDVTVKISDEKWQEAINRLHMYISEYAMIGWGGQFGLNGTLLPLKRRYDSGERTLELYNEMMAVE